MYVTLLGVSASLHEEMQSCAKLLHLDSLYWRIIGKPPGRGKASGIV